MVVVNVSAPNGVVAQVAVREVDAELYRATVVGRPDVAAHGLTQQEAISATLAQLVTYMRGGGGVAKAPLTACGRRTYSRESTISCISMSPSSYGIRQVFSQENTRRK